MIQGGTEASSVDDKTARLDFEFVVFTHEPFQYQQVAPEAARLRPLGMIERLAR